MSGLDSTKQSGRSTRPGSIRAKLIKITMITVFCALAFAALALIISEVVAHRNRTIESLESLALVVADRTTGAITFGDTELAAKNLRAMRLKNDVTTACVYDASGALFAQYTRGNKKDPACGNTPGTLKLYQRAQDSDVADSDIAVIRPIILDNTRIGSIFIRSDKSIFTKTMVNFAPVLFSVVLIALSVAYLLSTRLQRRIADPIIALAETTKKISAEHDYSVRAAKYSDDEVGVLIDHFNQMIALIEAQSRELVAAKSNLEATVAERTKELDVARHQAESANKAKTIFLANMSHELRTPMTSIIGFTELLQMDPSLTPGQKERLTIVERSGQQLLALINDVLELSKIEAGQVALDLGEFELKEILDTLSATFSPRAEHKGVKLEIDNYLTGNTRFVGDARKLHQILNNLIVNAIKFTDHGRITIVVEEIPDDRLFETTRIRFEVVDTGVGIDADEIDTIFDTFTQAESGRSSGQGTGLGLAIARQYVELMGGEITVQSTPGKGTSFQFNVTLQAGHAETIPGSNGTSARKVLKPNQPRLRMLIVDDNPNNRTLLGHILSSIGFSTKDANDGQQAIDIFREWQPDLIWMDMKMPIVDGYEATRRIRNSSGGREIPIIAITADVMDEDRPGIAEAGCNDIVNKPFRLSEIYNTIENYLDVELVNEA